MKAKSFIIIIILTIILVGCTNNSVISDFSSIENTMNYIEKCDYRGVNNKGNYEFAEALKRFLSNLENDNFKLHTQEFNIKTASNIEFSIIADDKKIVLDGENTVFSSINDQNGKIENVFITDNLEKICEGEKYIYISKDVKNLVKAKRNPNILAIVVSTDIENPDTGTIINDEVSTLFVDKLTLEKIKELIGLKVDITQKIEINEENLENIYTIYSTKECKDAIVITSHFDSTGKSEGKYSKGILDNGSGLAITLDLLESTVANELNTDKDIIFAFVNSEELLMLGSKELSKYLDDKYENVLNVNLDCLGEKGIETVSYGMSDSVSKEVVEREIEKIFGSYPLKKVDSYPSDNKNFNNHIYIYNFDILNNSDIHTSKDSIEIVDIKKLQDLSDKMYEFLKAIINIDMKTLLREDIQYTEAIKKQVDYINSLNFGEYVFYNTHDNPNDIMFFIQDSYRKELDDLSEISDKFCSSFKRGDRKYKIYAVFDLPPISYNNQALDEINNYFDEIMDFKTLVKTYEITDFMISSYDADTYNEYIFSVQKSVVEDEEEYQKEWIQRNLKDVVMVKDGSKDLYIGYLDNDEVTKVPKVIITTLPVEENYYTYTLNIIDEELMKLNEEDLIKLFNKHMEDVYKVINGNLN